MNATTGPVAELITSLEDLLAKFVASKGKEPRSPYPGFDRMHYPTDETMQAMFESGSFTWVCYYLAKTYIRSEPSWVGKRDTLVKQGWGLLPCYFGWQNFARPGYWNPPPHYPAPPKASAYPHWNKTQDAIDAAKIDSRQAADLALADGFPTGTVIYLDIESYDMQLHPLDPLYLEYVQGWFATLPTALSPNGPTYSPGVYLPRTPLKDGLYQLPAHTPTWATGGDRNKVVTGRVPDTEALDAKGWPLLKKPDECGTRTTVWQWGLGVHLTGTAANPKQHPYTVTDYDNHPIPLGTAGDELDFDSSWVADPSGTSGAGQINQVASLAQKSPGDKVVGASTVDLVISLERPATPGKETRVIVSVDGEPTNGDIPIGQSSTILTVPTPPVTATTTVTYKACTGWWEHSRAFAQREQQTAVPVRELQVQVDPP